MDTPTSLERAFALADVGLSAAEIRKALSSEGYPPGMISGTVAKQLQARRAAAKSEAQS